MQLYILQHSEYIAHLLLLKSENVCDIDISHHRINIKILSNLKWHIILYQHNANINGCEGQSLIKHPGYTKIHHVELNNKYTLIEHPQICLNVKTLMIKSKYFQCMHCKHSNRTFIQ